MFSEIGDMMETNLTLPKDNPTTLTIQNSWLETSLPREDIINGTLCIVAAQSPLVIEGKAKPGDIIDSTDSRIVIPSGQASEFTVCFFYKEWEQREVENGSSKLVNRFLYTKENANLPKEEKLGNKIIQNIKCLTFFALLPSYSPDFPVLVRFKKSNYFVGRTLITAMQRAIASKRHYTTLVFKLQTKLATWQTFKWFKFEVAPVLRDATVSEMELGNKWWCILNDKASDVIATQSEVDEETVPF